MSIIEGSLRSQEDGVAWRIDDALYANFELYLGYVYIYRYIQVRALGIFPSRAFKACMDILWMPCNWAPKKMLNGRGHYNIHENN